jgi:hypothetical protein
MQHLSVGTCSRLVLFKSYRLQHLLRHLGKQHFTRATCTSGSSSKLDRAANVKVVWWEVTCCLSFGKLTEHLTGECL